MCRVVCCAGFVEGRLVFIRQNQSLKCTLYGSHLLHRSFHGVGYYSQNIPVYSVETCSDACISMSS